MRVVIDTNVVVSALLFGGTPAELIPMWRASKITPYISKEILDEYIQVLSYPRFELTEAEIEYLVYREILPYFEIAELPAKRPVIVIDDSSDDLFLYCAQAVKAACILSGDRHLLTLKSFRNAPIITPAEFLNQFNG